MGLLEGFVLGCAAVCDVLWAMAVLDVAVLYMKLPQVRQKGGTALSRVLLGVFVGWGNSPTASLYTLQHCHGFCLKCL